MLYAWRDGINGTRCIHRATSNHSTCLLPAKPVLKLHNLVCHRKLYFSIYTKSFCSSYLHPDWNPSNKNTEIQGPKWEVLKLPTHLKAEQSGLYGNLRFFVGLVDVGGRVEGSRQSSAIFQHTHICVHICLHYICILLHTAIATFRLMSIFITIIGNLCWNSSQPATV